MSNREFHVEDAYQYDQSTPVRWILSHIIRYRFFIFSFVGGILLTNFVNSMLTRQVGVAFDQVLDGDARGLLFTTLFVLLLVLTRGLSDLGGQFSMEVIAKRLERDARDELYVNLLGKSQTFHNRQRIGDIMARATNDVREMNGMMMPGVALLGDSMAALVLPIIFIGVLDWRLLIAPLFFAVGFFFTLRRYMNALNPVSDAMRGRFGQMNAHLAESINGIEVVKTSAQEVGELKQFRQNAAAYKDAFVEQGLVQARYLPPLVLGVAYAIAFLHALFLWTNAQITVGEFVAYMGLMRLLSFPSFISIFTFALVQLGVAGADRILELMREETEIDENTALPSRDIQGEIVFDNVTFGYGDSPILKHITFTAAPGETIAIVGQTGSGKSTLTKLVNRTYDASEGRVLIDGVDVREWNLNSLRSQISTIEQDIFLFSRTVAENIAFGHPDASQAEIEQVAREAQADEFIRAFKDGYETEVGERGVTLSGGQRQRLAIARALLTDPRILIIDDATSAIDSATEDKIQQAINRVLEGRTTLLITHRLSQIRRADRILVLQHGSVLDTGTHEKLVERCELYRRIFMRAAVAAPSAAGGN